MPRKLWLSRRAHGRHMLTIAKPKIAPVHGAGYKDLYVRYGDPVGLSAEFCDMLAKECNAELEPLGSVLIEISAKLAGG